jgi:hypothetical protein
MLGDIKIEHIYDKKNNLFSTVPSVLVSNNHLP